MRRWAFLCGFLVLATLIAMLFGAPLWVVAVCKLGASTAFLLIARTQRATQSTYGRLVLAGLIASWLGDFFLLFDANALFLSGLVAFLLAHVLYATAFASFGLAQPAFSRALLVFAVASIAVGYGLYPQLGSMAVPVYAYMAVITAMVALSASAAVRAGSAAIVAGALLFYLSDLFVARERFLVESFANPLIGLPLYYAGQCALAETATPNTTYRAGANT